MKHSNLVFNFIHIFIEMRNELKMGVKPFFLLLIKAFKVQKLMIFFLLILIGLVSCGEENEDVFKLIVAQANSEFPRNSESDIIVLNDGRLLLGWTEFYGNSSADDGNARLVGRISTDEGRTWGDKYTLVEHEGGRNVMEVNFLRLKNGDIALFHLKKYDEVAGNWNNSTSETGDCRLVMRVSKDEGKTFSFVKEITQKDRYLETANSRGIMLKSGRILIECDDYFGNSLCIFSDDDGETWHEGKPVKPFDGGCWEPNAIQLKNGDLLMFLRTALGGQYQTISKDEGETWSEPTLSALRGSGAPIALERIPETGDLIAIWNHDVATMNNSYQGESQNKRSRNPLTSAISKDEGKTWENFRNIEDAPDDDAWTYPALTWVGDRALITYFSYKGGLSLHLKSMMSDWFYQEDSDLNN